MNVKFLLFVIVFIGAMRFCEKQTKGFNLQKIASVPLQLDSSPPGKEIASLLDQPYYFLGRGGQCFAFLSKDGKTVIKFFKQHHIRLWEWLDKLPLPQTMDSYRQKILRKHRHHSPLFFESCRIAFEEFRDRTGLIYLHLNQTAHFKKKLTIVDNLGISHQIDIDTTQFALQHKVTPSYSRLKQLIEKKDFAGAEECIDSILNLIVERSRKGISDRDPNIRRNFGFIGNKAIEIDLGSYTKAKKAYSLKNELVKTQKFKKWLRKRNVELSLYLNDRINHLEKIQVER